MTKRMAQGLGVVLLLSGLIILEGAAQQQAGDDQGGQAVEETPGATPSGRVVPGLPPMTFVTYNTGLAHGAVALADQRLPLIEAHLAGIDADVICLQEVWTDEDAAAIVSALEDTYPYTFRQVTEDTSEPSTPCGIFKTYFLKRCVDRKCESQGISTEECVATGPCKAKYDALADDCKRCLAANTAAPTSCALGGAQDFVSKGRNGLLLLSRHPIEHATYVPHDTLLVKRGMITADIQGYHTICTHLSADLGVVPYPPGRDFESWEDEHAAQVLALGEAAPGGRCTVLMGDLNAGPEDFGLTGELPENFKLLASEGYHWYWESPRCTWCKDNPLAGSEVDKLIDYIMFNGCPDGLQFEYHRIMDDPIDIEGQTSPTRLSDHYGVLVHVQPATR